ncbi:hypothetical protein [Bradyrhizobium liaoningense]|uniref:hypothetical protein n=1 Tax=Bradyrhizobium liaoningense TaxID=43992 RepID=UPI001BAD8C56|nr:hypothetical protein [Bradyrhizobium liaoningense]MBR0719102.1 hypothetical protein [Bradyrhizobium liaoningense]
MAIINIKQIAKSGLDEDAITTSTQGEHILNFGNLTTAGDLGDGIVAIASNVSISNFAQIETSGLGAMGIFVEGSGARIDNFGSIHTSGNDEPTVTSDAINVFGNAFRISNFGSIRVDGDFASAIVGIGDNSSILNAGDVESASIESIVIGILGNAGQLVNRGAIDVGGTDNAALLTRGTDASIINWGRVSLAGDFNQGITLQGEDSEAHNHGSIVVNAQNGFGIAAGGVGHFIDNDGTIAVRGSGSIAMSATGGPFTPEGADLQIVNVGQISVDGTSSFGVALGLGLPNFLGAALTATGGQIHNSGSIATLGDGSAAIVLIGNGNELINSGKVTANGGGADSDLLGLVRASGVLVSGDEVSIANERSGTITSNHAGSAAIELNMIVRDGVDNAELSSLVENRGLIKGVDVAISGGDGSETVINHGLIVGDVVLGGGSDTFVFGSAGSLFGNLFLGDGDDLVRVENGSGTTQIADFATGTGSHHDLIDVSQFFSNFATLAAHSRQSGNSVVISLDHNDELVLANVQLSALHSFDFLFA